MNLSSRPEPYVRLDRPGAIHHVFSRGNNRGAIFFCDDDRIEFLDRVARLAGHGAWHVLSYALLTNHFHLVVESRQRPIHGSMQRVLQPHAMRVNRRNGRTGHLFERRFGSRPVVDDADFLEIVRYVNLNPPLAGIHKLGAPYRWSSDNVFRGWRDDPFLDRRLASSFFGEGRNGAVRYDEFLQDGIERARRWYLRGRRTPPTREEALEGRPEARVSLPGSGIAEELPEEFAGAEALIRRVEEVIAEVERAHCLPPGAARGPRRDAAAARCRAEAACTAANDHAVPNVLIARCLGRTQGAVTRMIRSDERNRG